MFFEIAVGAFLLGTYAYHRWIEDKPPSPKPEDVRLPRTDEGSPIPLIYGRCRIRSPVLAFAGNYTPAENPTDPFTIDLLFIVGIPFFGGNMSDVQTGIPFAMFVGDIRVLTLTTAPGPSGVPPGTWFASFDSHTSQGEFYIGTQAQNVGNPVAPGNRTYLAMTAAGIPGTLIPGYRSMVCVSFCSTTGIGTGGLHVSSPQVPSLSFEVKSLSSGTASDFGHSLPDDADPVAVIHDLLTSPWGKLGLPTSKIDLPSFQAASNTLYAEMHGYSRVIEQPDEAANLINDVLRQIDAVLYEEPTTGKLTLKLIRNDYDVNILDSITPDNARPADGSWFSVSGWSETMNQVRVTWNNRGLGYSQAVTIGQNGANVTDQGKLRTIEISYTGCTSPELASKLASRELAVASKPIVKASLVCNRSFYAKRPGDVVKLTWPQLGISSMVMRIARVDLGQLHKGEIHLDLIRDVFDVSTGAFPVPI